MQNFKTIREIGPWFRVCMWKIKMLIFEVGGFSFSPPERMQQTIHIIIIKLIYREVLLLLYWCVVGVNRGGDERKFCMSL